MPESTIFKATYSGVPVYEMMCKGVAVMRRRADGWLNATQILKVAGFDKPQRTRVLERDIQKGEHEKVQGGYGKYQGTWIPLERGMALAKQYNCEHLLRPLISFQPEAKSPPLAPKHVVAPIPGRPAKRQPVETVSARPVRRREESDEEDASVRDSLDRTTSPGPSDISSNSPTPSPIRGDSVGFESDDGLDEPLMRSPSHGTKQRRVNRRRDDYDGSSNATDPKEYVDMILEYFISDSNQIPQILVNPPSNFDPNMVIDDDGHTTLHWASAMGRIRVVKLLLTAGADIFRINNAGQTPLMRSVMFANNYDVRKFPELYELLHRSTLNIDHFNRTVFHHIMELAMSKGKIHAARYYMETILNRLAEYPKELADIINFQDQEGETALTIAARCRSKRLVKLLIDHGADPKIANQDAKTTEDYILEDERFRASPVLPSRTSGMSFRNYQAANPPPGSGPNYSFAPANDNKPPLHYSVTAQIASTRCINDMAVMLDSLACSFDQELKEKEKDMTQASSLLGSIQSEILDSQRSVQQLKGQASGLEEAKTNLQMLEERLKQKMNQRYTADWEQWLRDQEDRERALRASEKGKSIPVVPGVPPEPSAPADGLLQPDTESSRAKGKRKVSEDEEIADLMKLYSDLPQNSEGNEKACNALRDELERQKKRRKETFEAYVMAQAEAGTSSKMGQYRRLISAGCGGIAPTEVDNVLGMLLESLEAEEPSASSVAWSSNGPRPGVAVG